MTRERKRAVLIIISTFIAGILIGVLATSLGGKYYGGRRGSHGGREGFVNKVLHVIEAEEGQKNKIKPFIEETITRIDSLQAKTDKSVHAVLDSFEIKVTPILKPEQLKKLKEFHEHGRNKH